MPIPDFTAQGLLPDGIHECTLDEVRDRFGRFQSSDRRIQLLQKLTQFLHEARLTTLVKGIFIDGSFVTNKDEPNDIDLILVLQPDHDFSLELRPFEYNVLSRNQVRRHYQFDLLVANEGGERYQECIDFFAQVRDKPNQRKGMLWVKL